MLTTFDKRKRRAQRVRFKIWGQNSGRPRLSIFRSNKHIHCQIIDDATGTTKASASSFADFGKDMGKKAANKEIARKVGTLLAERASKAGVKEVVLDKGAYKFHGQVAELAAGAREAGLKF